MGEEEDLWCGFPVFTLEPMADQPHANQKTKPSSCVEQRAFLVHFSSQSEYTFSEPGLPPFPISGGGLFSLLLFSA